MMRKKTYKIFPFSQKHTRTRYSQRNIENTDAVYSGRTLLCCIKRETVSLVQGRFIVFT